MALKDSIKHFKDVDNYNTYFEKKDLDNNMDILADAIDKTPFEEDVDNKIITPKNSDDSLIVGGQSFVLEDTDNGDSKVYFDKTNSAFRGGFIKNDSWGTRGKNSFAFGYNANSSSDNSYTIGYNAKNNQELSSAFGVGLSNTAFHFLKHINTLYTTDDTQTSFNTSIILEEKSYILIEIISTNITDDYATRWAFNRYIEITVNSDRNVTILTDSNSDIRKDDDDWKFDITSTDGDSDNKAYLTLSVTGKADTNIAWGYKAKLNYSTFTS